MRFRFRQINGLADAQANFEQLEAIPELLPVITALPAADISQQGVIVTLAGAAGIADVLKVCLKSSTGTYSWITIVSG